MFELKRIGLFCGCFNPIHSGHIRAAELFRSAVGLECVFLVPANVSYHKFGAPMESGFHRLKMCELAVEGHAGLAVCDFEIKAPKAPYTIDTVLFSKTVFLIQKSICVWVRIPRRRLPAGHVLRS